MSETKKPIISSYELAPVIVDTVMVAADQYDTRNSNFIVGQAKTVGNLMYNHSIPPSKGGGSGGSNNSGSFYGDNFGTGYAGAGDSGSSRGGSAPAGPSHIVGLSSGSGNGVTGHHSVSGGQGVAAYNGGAAKPPKPQTPNYSSDSYNQAIRRSTTNRAVIHWAVVTMAANSAHPTTASRFTLTRAAARTSPM